MNCLWKYASFCDRLMMRDQESAHLYCKHILIHILFARDKPFPKFIGYLDCFCFVIFHQFSISARKCKCISISSYLTLVNVVWDIWLHRRMNVVVFFFLICLFLEQPKTHPWSKAFLHQELTKLEQNYIMRMIIIIRGLNYVKLYKSKCNQEKY